MPSVSDIKDATLVIHTSLDDQARAGFDEGAKAADRYEAAARKAAASVAAVSDETRQISTTSTAWDRLAARNDEVTAASNRLTAARGALARAEVEGQVAARGSVEQQQQYERVIASLTTRVKEMEAALSRVSADAATRTAAQESWNASMRQGAAGMGQLAQSTRDFGLQSAQMTGSLSAQRAAIDSVYRASKEYEFQLARIDQAVRDGAISETAAIGVRERATASFAGLSQPMQSMASNSKAASVAIRDFGLQSIDVFSQLGSGAPIFRTFIQQGSQVVQVAIAMGVSMRQLAEGIGKSLLSALSFIITPMGLLVTATAAVSAAFAYLAVSAETANQASSKLRGVLSGTRSDYEEAARGVEAAAKNIAHSTSLSLADATTAARTIATVPGVAVSAIEGLARMTEGLAASMGTSVEAAAKLVTTAITDPIKAVQDLAASGFRGLDSVAQAQVTNLVQLGHSGEATKVILAGIGSVAKKAADDQTPLTKAFQELTKTMYGTEEGADGLFRRIGSGMNEWAAVMVHGLQRIVEAIQSLLPQLQDFADKANGIQDKLLNKWPQAFAGAANQAQDALIGPNGALLFGNQQSAVSSAGAVGAGQLLPSTAAQFRNPFTGSALDLTNPSDNISAMLQYIKQLSGMALGSSPAGSALPQQIAGAYNLGPTGYNNAPQNARGYQQKVLNADVSKVPTSTAGLIQYWGNVLGLTDDQINLGMRIVMVENQGQQGPLAGRPSVPAGNASAAAQSSGSDLGAAINAGGAAGDIAAEKARADAAIKTRESLLAEQKQIRDLTESLVGLRAEQEKANKAGDTKLAAEYGAAIAAQEYNLKKATDRTLEYSQATRDQAAVLRTVGGAAQELLRTQQEIDQHDRENAQNPFTAAEKAERLAGAQLKLSAEYDKSILSLDKSNAELLKQADALDLSGKASADAKIAQQAYNESIDKFLPGTEAQKAAEAKLNEEYQTQAQLLERMATAQEHRQNQDALTFLRAEIDTLGQDSQAREAYLAGLQNEQQVRQQHGNDTEATIQSLIAEKNAISAVSQEYKQQQATMNYLAGVAENAFSTIGNAITQAFVQGQGAAVNWGNVVKAVISQVIQAALQLTILNPILNSLGGEHRQTLSDVFGGSGGLGGIASLLQLGGSASTISGALGGPSIGGLFSEGGYFGGLGSSVSGLLQTPVFGGGTSILGSTVSGGETAFLGSAGININAGAGGLTYGGLLGIGGSALAGYGLGTTLGGAIAGNRQSGQQNAQIGSATGAVAGAIIGSVVPVIGTAIGGILGGLIGGAGGSLFGPKNASPFSLTNVGIGQNGLLQIGSTASQISGSNRSATQQEIDAINQVLSANGLTVNGSRGAGFGSVGSEPNNPTHAGTNFAGENVASLFSNLKFSSTDPHLQTFLSANGGAGFQDVNTLQTVMATVQKFVSAVGSTDFAGNIDKVLSRAEALGAAAGGDYLNQVATFVTQTVPALTNTTNGTGSLRDALDKLIATYAPAIAMAQQLGYKEAELTDARDKALQTASQAAQDALYQSDVSLSVRKATADASLSGNPDDVAAAKLAAFDAQAGAERTSFAKSMTDVFGQSYASTEQYANQMAYLEATLQSERLALQQQGNTKILNNQQTFQSDLLQTANPALSVRRYNAGAQASGDPQVQLNAALYAFDVQATAERTAFGKQMTDAFGTAFGNTQTFVDEMATLEATLQAERYLIQKNGNDQIIAAAKQASETLAANQLGYYQQGQQLTVRIRTAQAQASGDSNQIVAAQLFAFDTQAAEQRAALSKQLISTFGDSFVATSNYADRMVQLEQTLQAERVAVQSQGNAQILAQTKQAQSTAASLVTSIAQYVDNLSTSAASALSPQDQYSLSQSRFNAVSGAARAGDYNSLQQLTGYADSFLNASRVVNGSGQQYAIDFQHVIDALNQVANVNPDTLTASILAAETRTQTATLVDALSTLGTKLDAINVQIKQGALQPTRIAA